MKINNLDQLRSEKAEAERKRDQAQRQANRYANQIEYVQKRSRSERTHHLCIIGGAVESVAPIRCGNGKGFLWRKTALPKA